MGKEGPGRSRQHKTNTTPLPDGPLTSGFRLA
jgi:hypothetical protein